MGVREKGAGRRGSGCCEGVGEGCSVAAVAMVGFVREGCWRIGVGLVGRDGCLPALQFVV